MTRPLFLLSTAIVILVSSLPLAAQKYLPKAILFKGDPEYSDQELMTALGLKKGDVLDYADMSAHSKRLMDSGVLEGITFKFDGVNLIFSLKPAEQLFPIRLDNLPLTPGKDLDAKLHDRLPLYHGKVPPEGTLLNDVREALEDMLAAQGIKTTVTTTPYAVMGQHKASAISFGITQPEVRVGAIHLEGVSPALQTKVKLVADDTTKTAFNTEDTAHNIERAFSMFYADEGYAAVRVHAARSGDPVISAQAIDLPFSVTIEEGRLYKLGSIHLPPGALPTQAEIDKAAGLGTNMTVNGIALRTAWSLIAERYKAKGYLDCIVTPHPDLDEASGAVNYTVAINLGPVYHLAFVKFDNVSDELRSRLMRVWQMLPGDPFDESYVANFILKAQKDDPVLQRTLAGVKANYEVMADPQTHEVNCVIRLEKIAAHS